MYKHILVAYLLLVGIYRACAPVHSSLTRKRADPFDEINDI